MSKSKRFQEVWLECPRCGVEIYRILEHHFDQPGLTRSCPDCRALTYLCVETRDDRQIAYLVIDDEELPCRDRAAEIPRATWELMEGEVRAIIDALILGGREAEILIAALVAYDPSKPYRWASDRREYERGVADLIAYRKRCLES